MTTRDKFRIRLEFMIIQRLARRPFGNCLIRLSAIALLSMPLAAGAAQEAYRFGVVPQQSATKLARTWVPFLRLLQEKTGIELRFATAPDIPTFEKRLAQGEYDFAYMNPYHYTVFHQSPGYRAFAKQADRQIRGILVVRQDSPARSVTDLNGQQIAFPAPAAFAATLLVRSYLESEAIDYEPRFVSSHDSVYRAVAGGFAGAGGGIVRTLESLDEDIRRQLRILWESAGFTPHAFAAHPRMPGETVERLLQAMRELSEYPEGVEVLRKINIKALEKASSENWDDVRGLNMNFLSPAR